MDSGYQTLRLKDTLARPLRSLRVSVTDRCNIRCQYCMPEESYLWLPRTDLLSFEEVARLVHIFARLGVDRVRLTGGEPLLRHEVHKLVQLLAQDARIEDLALTTNGILLADYARELRDAGLQRVTVSLDTLRSERFEALNRSKGLDRVLDGIDAVRRVGFGDLKIDSVILRGVNEDELSDLIEFGKGVGAEIRFIEYMDVGGATRWSMERVFSKTEILHALRERYGPIDPVVDERWAPAERFSLPDRTVFGIIASTTAPFCRTCDRSRLTADGLWYLCLYAEQGTDLRRFLRAGATDEEISSVVEARWTARADRGAEIRKETAERGALVGTKELRRDPHREMHTRGG